MPVSHLFANGHHLEYRWVHPGGAAVRNASRPTLVFLHEGLGSTALWKNFPDLVADATGCSALVYSRYGYGRSDPLGEARDVHYMHREALETLPSVLRGLAIDAPILIGHSDGASIALIHAGAGKWAVRGVVAMAPHVFVEDITVASIAQAKVTFQTTDLAVKLARYHDDATGTFSGWNDIWLHPDFRAWNIEAYLPSIAVPILLVQGEDDQYGTRAQVDAIARQVSGPSQVLMLASCAHSPHVDQRERTVGAIAQFVDTLTPPLGNL
ncbi:MAG: alpha/beta hydrolase [Betaproteobacteria bacterium]